MKKLVFLIMGITLVSMISSAEVFSQNRELTRDQIIQIAVKAYEKSGGDVKYRTAVYDEGNKRWQEKYKTINKEMVPRYEVLKDKNYQAICLDLTPPKGEMWLGGDAWYFIDKTTGEILAFYGEK